MLRRKQGTGEVRDPLADSPEEESRISPPCGLSSKAFCSTLGTLGRILLKQEIDWSYFTENISAEFHHLISASTFSDDLIFHCWTFRLVLLAYERCRNDQKIKTEKQQRLLFFTQENYPFQAHFCYKRRGGLCFHTWVHATLQLEQGMCFG